MTRKYLEAFPHPDVDATALISPVVRPGQVYYPPPGAWRGWGLAAGWELRGVLALMGLRRETPISADEPFVRSVLADAPLFRNRMLCPVPGVRMIGIPAQRRRLHHPAGELPRHPGRRPSGHARRPARLPGRAGAAGGIPQRRRHRAPAAPYYSLVQEASGVWQAPVLALAVNPVWHAAGQPDAALRGEACPASR